MNTRDPALPLHTALSRVARVRRPDRCARCSEEDANLIVRAVTLARLSTHCEYQDMYAVEQHFYSEFNTRLVV